MVTGWGDGTSAAHTLQQQICAEDQEQVTAPRWQPAGDPGTEVCALSQTDMAVNQTEFLPARPTFSGGEALSEHFFS